MLNLMECERCGNGMLVKLADLVQLVSCSRYPKQFIYNFKPKSMILYCLHDLLFFEVKTLCHNDEWQYIFPFAMIMQIMMHVKINCRWEIE